MSGGGGRELAKHFTQLLLDRGYDFFAGVPCSLVKELILELETTSRYHPETREDAAVGLAVGAYLAGHKACVVMQNSGLGVCLNSLTSLSLMYETPQLLLVTHRGLGKDAPEHLLMGAVCGKLLDVIGVPHRTLGRDSLEPCIDWADAWMTEKSTPACLLVPPGLFDGAPHE